MRFCFSIKLCPKYVRGLCRKGSRCSYAHTEEQLRDVPNLWKTKLCSAYRFVRPESAVLPSSGSREETPAGNYRNGFCSLLSYKAQNQFAGGLGPGLAGLLGSLSASE